MREDPVDDIKEEVTVTITKKSNIGSSVKKRKTLEYPVEWEDKIKEYHPGTVSSYWLAALQEKMKIDGIL